jgi:hypothetical protein
MRHKRFSSLAIAMMITIFVSHGPMALRDVAAQDNSSLFVGKPVPVATVKRVAKKGRVINKARPRAKVARVPLLAVQLRLLKVKEDGSAVETNPVSQFYANDRLRLSVKPNQDGYLTIIKQSGPNDDGQILFPTSLLNDGGNYVTANKEFVVPSNCPANLKSADCAYVIPESAGTQIFTVIFSRDLIMDLPENAKTPTGTIRAQLINDIESSSIKQLEIRSGASPFAILVLNKNRDDNEEIFTRFGVTSLGASPLKK